MPYIEKTRKDVILPTLISASREIETIGELNYAITKLILHYLERREIDNDSRRTYKDLNECMGVLTCCQQELYQRVVAPYEQIKCKINGDVF